MRGEEGVQAQLAIEFQGEPAATPLAWPPQREFVQADAHDALVIGGRGAVVGEEGDLGGRIGAGVWASRVLRQAARWESLTSPR